ncbi:SusC/RagA family TonB-linked outer membrane protein [Lutibacter holmesii]|uniref:SusC/RagA family TonB-linked outer membrane protein n=1 Tax=Lutibacter holmesii TaxID=1137985 RepID=A0ABW3WMC2_9FLAO
MKTKFNGILTLLLAFMVQITFAQEKTVTGKVTDASGPLPGVTVVVKGTSTGTQTDFDGNYSIKANTGAILQFSFIGMEAIDKTVETSNVLNVQMIESAQALDEVVITGLGIKREKQALGYAVSKVDAKEIQQKSEGDIGRVLSGKASGVNIQSQSGMSGSGTSIIIRGMNSFSGSNQPLFIVDGVPFSSDTNAQGDFVDGNNGSSRFLDLDPNNIENVNILKGLAASTLYGTQGRNGVILITTKSGSTTKGPKKTEITVTSSAFINEIASMPNYQNEYGGGFDQSFGWFFSNWGPSFEKDGPAGWGSQAAFDENGTVEHPYSTASAATGIPAAFPEYAGERYEYKPYESVENFFRQGVILNNSINIRGSSDDGKVSYNASYSNLDDTGFTPGNTLKRNSFSLGGRAILSNKFTVSGTMNYTKTNFKTPPVAASYGSNVSGNNASIFANLFYTPRSVDLMGLPYQNPVTGESVYYRQNNSIQNPLWTVENAGNTQDTHRVFGSLSLAYELNDNMNLTYRYGYDMYSENNSNYSNKGGKTGSEANQSGVYETWNNTNTIDDHNITLNGNYDISESLDISFSAGATSRRDVYDRNGVASVGQQVFGTLKHFNFAEQDEIEYYEERNILGLYGQAELGLNSYLYLTLAARKDWVSNLTDANNSIAYPSASVSFIPTKAFDIKSNTLNYLKFRAGYGTSANFPTGYPVSSTLSLNTQDFIDEDGTKIVTNTSGSQLGNTNLKPERIDEIEFGVEGRFFNNRISLDASLYSRKTRDLIISQPLDPSTGYSTTQTNVGEVQNDGIEIDLGIDWIAKQDFNWNTNINFTKNEAIVNDLGQDTDMIVFAGFTNLGNAAIEGESLGTMVGSTIAKDDNGNLMVNSSGSYEVDNDTNIIGDSTPDFMFNFGNSVSYKNFSLNFLFTWTQGGDMYAMTPSTLLGRGVVNAEGVDRANSFVLPGVGPDGEENTVQINNSTYYFSNLLYGPDEMLVYDATVVRLQELSLSYRLSDKALAKTPFGSVSITFTGNNLWFNAPNMPKNTNFDPNVAGLGVGNGSGFEYLNGPSSRRYGMSLKASF